MARSIIALSVLATALLLQLPQKTAVAQFAGRANFSVRSATRNYIYNRPTVSPYLNLTSRDSQIGLPNYFTQVRPQVEQRNQAVAQQRQSAQMQRQLDQVQNEMRQNQQQSTGMTITGRVGWSSRGLPRFGSYMSYFPGFRQIPR